MKKLAARRLKAAWGGIASLQLGLPAIWTGPGPGTSASWIWPAGWRRQARLVGLAAERA